MTVQIIRDGETPQYAVLPYDTYLKLVNDAEELEDIRDFDAAKKTILEGEETVPAELIFSILDGENPIRAWRKFRGLSQKAVAEGAGISTAYLSQIESEKRTGSIDLYKIIAAVLEVEIDDLV